MSVTVSTKAVGIDFSFDTGLGSLAATSGSFTPSNNSMLIAVVVAYGDPNTSATKITNTRTTITDTQSLTWTCVLRRDVNELRSEDMDPTEFASVPFGFASNYCGYLEVWVAQVTTGASMTVTTQAASAAWTISGDSAMGLQILQATGHDPKTPIGASTIISSSTENGSVSLTLSQDPVAGSAVFAGRWFNNGLLGAGRGDVTATPNGSYTELYDNPFGFSTAGYLSIQTEWGTGFTSASITPWSDINDGDLGAFFLPVCFAFEIRAASSSTVDFVQKASSGRISNTHPATATFGSSVTANNLVVVIISGFSTNGYSSVTDNKGNTYTRADHVTSGGEDCAIYYSVVSTGGSSFAVTLNPVTTDDFAGWFEIAEFSGLATSSVLDLHVTNNTALSSGDRDKSLASGGTLATATELVVALESAELNDSISVINVPWGFTELDTRNDIANTTIFNFSYRITNANPAVTAKWTFPISTGTDVQNSVLATFKITSSSNVTMTASSNSFVWGATAVTFAHSLSAASKSYSWSATAVTFAHSLLVAAKAYTWSATAATFAIAMSAASKAYTWSATAVTFAKVLSITAASRAYIWSAQAVALVVTTANVVRSNALKLGISIGNKMGISI